MTTIKLEGLDELERKLGKLVADAVVNRAIKASVVHLKGKINEYPTATDANTPKSNGAWYERGYGSRWRRADGSLGGRQSSETLGRKWTIRTGNRWGIVGNNVSYGPYVQGATRQASRMADIGWKTTGEVAEEEKKRIMAFFVREIRKEWRK